MPSSDEHLEEALEDYNDKIHALESEGGTEEELMDAYVNRGCVLSMMGHYISAISDFDDATDIMMHIEASGRKVDAGTAVKAFVSRGEIRGEDDARLMADDYANAALRLPELTQDSKYYDRKKIVLMCLCCAEDLVDGGFQSEVYPFIDKAMPFIAGKKDSWSRNCLVDLLNAKGQAEADLGDDEDAIDTLTSSIEVAISLMKDGELDDPMSLVFPYVTRGDVEERIGSLEDFIMDRKAAILLLEQMHEDGILDDVKLLSLLHREIADAYFRTNRVKEAEEHLMREVSLDMRGAKEYIDEYARRPDGEQH